MVRLRSSLIVPGRFDLPRGVHGRRHVAGHLGLFLAGRPLLAGRSSGAFPCAAGPFCKKLAMRHDLFSMTNYSAEVMAYDLLAHGEDAAAASEVDDAIRRWSDRGFHVQHLFALVAKVRIDLYRGHGPAAISASGPPYRPIAGQGSMRLRSRINMNQLIGLRRSGLGQGGPSRWPVARSCRRSTPPRARSGSLRNCPGHNDPRWNRFEAWKPGRGGRLLPNCCPGISQPEDAPSCGRDRAPACGTGAG